MYYSALGFAKKLNKQDGRFLVEIYNRRSWSRVKTDKKKKKEKEKENSRKVPSLSDMCCRVIASELRRESIESLVASIESQLPEELVVKVISQLRLLEENCLGFEV